MGHFLKTINPEAAKAIEDGMKAQEPTPRIGDMVQFFPRPGELRAGRGKHAAIVSAEHEDGTLDLVVVYDGDDLVGQRRVPRRDPDGGMGWEPIKRAGDGGAYDNHSQAIIEKLTAEVAALKALVIGNLTLGEGESVVGILDEFDTRISAVEKGARAAPTRTKKKTKASPKPPAT